MPSVHDLTHRSGFVFEAAVEQLAASTAAGFPASGETAIVRITRIFRGPAALAGYGGQRITVALQPPVTLKAGQSAVFFTHGAHYGEGLVVRELGNVPPEATMESQVNSAAQASSDDEMTQRLAQADLVITGVASAPKRFAQPSTRRISEHDPDWWVSTINVETVEKGVHTAPTKDILFPHSMDIAWHRAPKVKEGDRGVWLLHNRDRFGKAVPAHAIVHPLDFRPMAEVENVRALLKGGPR
jgi:hypothetical protein